MHIFQIYKFFVTIIDITIFLKLKLIKIIAPKNLAQWKHKQNNDIKVK